MAILFLKRTPLTTFNDNSGSAIFSIRNCNVIFKDNSRLIYNNNIVHHCGVLTSAQFSNITFTNIPKLAMIPIQCHVPSALFTEAKSYLRYIR